LNAFNTEPEPVTSTLEVPLIESPMVVNVVEVTGAAVGYDERAQTAGAAAANRET
jgi:hypothetical protein